VFCAVAQVTQITFQAALDPFHSMFRLLRLRELIKQFGALPRDQARILDFYLLFPFRVRDIRLAPKHQRYKKLAEKYAHLTPYGEQPDAPALFNRMEPIQAAALETLASRHFINPIKLARGEVDSTNQLAPNGVMKRIEELNAQQGDLMEFLGVLASDYALLGDQGLKARTGLLEHRYDAV
jgi:hypothetical protein